MAMSDRAKIDTHAGNRDPPVVVAEAGELHVVVFVEFELQL
jgi:hypothetical protein